MQIRSISRSSLIVGVLVFGALLGGCATSHPERESQRQAAYRAATGAPVRSFRFFGSLYSWEPLGDQQLAVYTRPNQAWLLDVPGCNELPFATAIGLTSNMHEVMTGFDHVLTGHGNIPCTIMQIRPIDVGKLKAAQEARRKIEEKPRPPKDTP
jgi:hypothetical protein